MNRNREQIREVPYLMPNQTWMTSTVVGTDKYWKIVLCNRRSFKRWDKSDYAYIERTTNSILSLSHCHPFIHNVLLGLSILSLSPSLPCLLLCRLSRTSAVAAVGDDVHYRTTISYLIGKQRQQSNMISSATTSTTGQLSPKPNFKSTAVL
jgi:hypothetical protein